MVSPSPMNSSYAFNVRKLSLTAMGFVCPLQLTISVCDFLLIGYIIYINIYNIKLERKVFFFLSTVNCQGEELD